MGFFRKKPKMIDRIWLNADLKFQDNLNMIKTALDNGQVPLCIFHFRDSGKQMKTDMETNGYRTHAIQSVGELNASSVEGWRVRTDVILMKSDGITRHDISQKMTLNSKIVFTPYLLERYPTPGRDELILKVISKRSDMDDLTSFVSLDEAWLKEIMSDRVTDLMEKLGMEKEEVLQHPMISNSLRRVQEKLGKKVRRDLPYDSLEKWLDANISSEGKT